MCTSHTEDCPQNPSGTCLDCSLGYATARQAVGIRYYEIIIIFIYYNCPLATTLSAFGIMFCEHLRNYNTYCSA